MFEQQQALILASGSSIRQQLLKDVGLNFSAMPASLDEDAYKKALGRQAPDTLAMKLAQAKAKSVAREYADQIVIGCDQVCSLDEKIFQKPGSSERCIQQLIQLSGNTHTLHSSVCLAQGENILWSYTAKVSLTMRPLDKKDIEAYVAKDQPLYSCGSYYFESLGRHLFQSVEGCQDSILGLPLVPLLNAMYEHSILS